MNTYIVRSINYHYSVDYDTDKEHRELHIRFLRHHKIFKFSKELLEDQGLTDKGIKWLISLINSNIRE